MATDSSYWVLPVINDIIDFADKHGFEELGEDLTALARKHFSEEKCAALKIPEPKIVRFAEFRRR